MASCKFCHTIDFISSQFPAAIKKAKKLKTKNKKQITENITNKKENVWKLCKPFFPGEGFHYKQKCTLRTRRGVKSSAKTIANIFNKLLWRSFKINRWNKFL